MRDSQLFAARALLPEGWARDVLFEISATGELVAVTRSARAGAAPLAKGPVLPGMPNLHSHAFQRAMAGLAEGAPGDTPGGEDSFWTWRELMYRLVARLEPAQVEAIAAQLYVEMVKAGYTAVGEFHYLHHDPEGHPYGELALMAERVIAAAAGAGIGITLLPVLYGYDGFGGRPPHDGQRRFLNDPERLLKLIEALISRHAGDPRVRIGLAPHSLRAVTPETLAAALHGLEQLDRAAPVHIHIAEQLREVRDCIAWCGARPLEWLLDNAPVGARWCPIHATHMTETETRRLAETGAVVGLCPTTEANLGDGLFPAPAYLGAGGAFGIGSDSQVSVSPIEELRWLEYGQRLHLRRRNLLGGGAKLYKQALAGGAQALARPIGRLAAGCRADLLVLDGTHPNLAGKTGDLLLEALVFAGNENPVTDVMVGGVWVVRDRHHPREAEIADAYRRAVAALLE